MNFSSPQSARASAMAAGLALAVICSLVAPCRAANWPEGAHEAAPAPATFGRPSQYHTVPNGTAFDIASGDFTGTNIKDIVIANGVGASVSLLAGHGDGTFAPAVTVYAAPDKSVTAIATGDFNADRHLDLAVVTEGGSTQDVVILLGDGRRHFHVSAMAPLRYLSQVGPLIFGGIRAIAVGKFTRGGFLDVAVTDGVNYISIFSGDGRGGLRARQDPLAAAVPSSILIANLYGHGLFDIGVVDNDSSSVYTLEGHGDGTFAPRRRTPLGALPVNAAPVSLSAGDLRCNGRIDLFAVYSATPNSGNTVGKILLSDGHGSYAKAAEVPIAGYVAFPWVGSIADFNGDGIPDLAVVAENFPSQNDVVVLPGKGDGTFSTAAQTLVKMPYGGGMVLIPDKIIVDDFNGDGKPDIAVAYDRTRGMGVSVLLNTTKTKPRIACPMLSTLIQRQ